MANLEELKNKVNLVEYIQKTTGAKIKRLGNGTFDVEPCPVCNHKGHFRVNNKENYYNSFNGCCNGGSIIDFMQEIEGLTKTQAIEKLYKITNTPIQEYKPNFKRENAKKTQDKKEIEQIQNFVFENYKKMQDRDELIKYLNSRNISQNAIEKYKLFIKQDDKGIKRVYIPIFEQNKPIAYIGRAINNEVNLRYMNSKGTMQPFNLDYIKEKSKENEPIYICEGIFDAISIEEQGKKAISLNSTQNKTKLIEAIKNNIETAKGYIYIIASDNDEARRKP